MSLKELFPAKYVTGFIFSLVLTVAALSVWYFDLSYQVGLSILIVTAFIQAGVQLVMFMHVGESEDKISIYTHTYYAVAMGLIIVIGTLFTMIWGYQ